MTKLLSDVHTACAYARKAVLEVHEDGLLLRKILRAVNALEAARSLVYRTPEQRAETDALFARFPGPDVTPHGDD